MNILLNTQLTILMHYTALPESRDFLFELSENMHLSLYTHLINATFSSIVVKNDSSKTVTIPHNSQLGTVHEINYNNCYHVKGDMSDLAS